MERLTEHIKNGEYCLAMEDEWKAIDKLGEYEDLEEKGLLVKLPCKVGDTLYVVYSKSITETKVAGFIYENNRWIVSTTNFDDHGYKNTHYIASEHIGKEEVFLTKEAAQKALEGTI